MYLLLLVILFITQLNGKPHDFAIQEQHLPNCTAFDWISKVTQKQAGVCVMVKDEEGFLSEFVAYYL